MPDKPQIEPPRTDATNREAQNKGPLDWLATFLPILITLVLGLITYYEHVSLQTSRNDLDHLLSINKNNLDATLAASKNTLDTLLAANKNGLDRTLADRRNALDALLAQRSAG